jgi:hypothetical protein
MEIVDASNGKAGLSLVGLRSQIFFGKTSAS